MICGVPPNHAQTIKFSSLNVVVGHDEGVQLRQVLLQVLAEPADPVVVEEQGLDPGEEGDVVNLADLVVGEVDGVELVQGRTEVLDEGDLVALKDIKITLQ